MEIIPVINPETKHIIDNVERSEVRKNRLWHFSSLILPIQEKTGKILIQKRPKGKTFEGKSDIFGGFVNQSETSEELKKSFSIKKLEQLFLETAVKESNEELEIFLNGNKIFTDEHKLTLINPFAGFIADNEINREISSVYSVIIPFDCLVETYDDVQGKIVQIESKFVEFDKLKVVYKRNPENFADSLYRVLYYYFNNTITERQINTIINNCT